LALSGPAGGLNGGPAFKHSETFSFQIATDDQEETAIGPVRRQMAASEGEDVSPLPSGWKLRPTGATRSIPHLIAQGNGFALTAIHDWSIGVIVPRG